MSIWSKYLTPTKTTQTTQQEAQASWQMPGMGLIEQPTKSPLVTQEFGAIPGLERPIQAAQALQEKPPDVPFTLTTEDGKDLNLVFRSSDRKVYYEGYPQVSATLVGSIDEGGNFIPRDPTTQEKIGFATLKAIEYVFYPFTLLGMASQELLGAGITLHPGAALAGLPKQISELRQLIGEGKMPEQYQPPRPLSKELLPGGKIYEEYQNLPWWQQISLEAPAWMALMATGGATAMRARLAHTATKGGVPGVTAQVTRGALAPVAASEWVMGQAFRYTIGQLPKIGVKVSETVAKHNFANSAGGKRLIAIWGKDSPQSNALYKIWRLNQKPPPKGQPTDFYKKVALREFAEQYRTDPIFRQGVNKIAGISPEAGAARPPTPPTAPQRPTALPSGVRPTPTVTGLLPETVTGITPTITEAPTVAMAEWGVPIEGGTLFIPPTLPIAPPPVTPEGRILGRSENEWEGFMADLQDAETVADIAFRNDMVRKWANNLPGLREFYKILNPSVIANTPGEKAIITRATLRDEGYQKTQGVMAHLQEVGGQDKIFGDLDSKGLIKSGVLKGQTIGDIAQQRAKWETKLTDEQRFWLDRADTIEKSVTGFLKRNEIDINLLKLEEGGQFATRRVWGKSLNDGTVIDVAYVGAGPGRPGSRLPTEKQRYFKTEAEAIEAGYHYIPYEEALYLKVSGAYNRVADKKMADWLLTKVTWRTTGAPEELVLAAEAARLKMRHSQMLLAGLNRAVRGERLPDVTIRAIATSYPDQAQALKDLIPRLQAAKPSAKEIRNLTNVAKGLIDTNKMMYWKAVNARVKARERAMTAGYEEAQIPAPAFSGKILTGPEAKETARTLRESFEPSFNKVLGEVNKANAVARYFMLAGDYSPFTIQLIFLLGENPKIYGKAFGGAIRAMVNPKFQSKFLSRHKATIDKHPNLLISKGGATEFTEAMARGGWLSGKTSFRPEAEAYWKSLGLFLPRAVGKVGGTVLTPFQRVFESSLDSAGIYMAEAYEHLCTTPERTADVDQFINEFRGLTSSARIGISGKQRQLETFTLLAPRYNRAIAGLLFDLSRGNIRGHLARKSLIKGIAALCAIAVAISIARGEDEEEIIEHFNPNSSMFFTWDVAGQKIGPGSKVRSLIKLIAQSSSDPEELLEFSMDNPALRFVRGNLAPVLGSSVDLITGRSYIGDPTRDGMLSFSKEILAGNLLPIWVQSTLMEGGDVKGRTWRGFAEFFGGRAYPEPLWDEVRKLREKYAKQDFDIKYEDLNRAQIDKLKGNHPDLNELEEEARLEQAERGNEFEQAFYQMREEAIETRNTKLDEAATLLLNDSISKYDYDKERGYVRPYYSGGMSVLYGLRDRLDPKAIRDIQEWLSENQKPEDKAMDEYQEHRASLIEKADLPRDWDEIEAQCEKFLTKYPKKIQGYIEDNLSRWINDLPENAKQIELMRLQGIEDETWWDDYRGATTTPGSMWSGYLGGDTTQGSIWSKYR